MKSIGVFGGAFDPVHIGHLRTAYEMLHELVLDELRFVPASLPPHREPPIASVELRLAMLQAAIPAHEHISIDQRELRRSGTSYTVDTLVSLREEFPDASLCLIIGMDAFLAFTSWHRWREILELAHIVVAYRPGTELPVTGAIGELLEARRTGDKVDVVRQPSGRILIQPTTQLHISSSAIRRIVAQGGDPRYLVPGPVRELIMESDCYAKLVDAGDARENRSSAQ
jgi:nicotinate-nucleotide adenylyltransferase